MSFCINSGHETEVYLKKGGGSNLNILDYLDSKETTNQVVKHPLADKADEFKSIYCFGIATLAFGYKKNLPDIGRCFSKLLRSMEVDEKKEKQIISSVYTVFDFKITEVFEKICDKTEQYCFVSDLYKIANGSLLSPTYCQDIIEGYMRAFSFTKEEKNFFKEFMACSAEKQKINESMMMVKKAQEEKILKEAVNSYETFQENGCRIPYVMLKYMFPGFDRKEKMEDLLLLDGEKIIIDYPVEIFGRIELKNGSSLLIENTTVIFHCPFNIDGGKVCIKDSKILIEECLEESFINIEETTLCHIENSEIDCKGKTAFLHQNGGNLKIMKSVIEDTSGKSAITFLGKDINIEETSFLHCQNGAVWNDAQGGMKLRSCRFSYCNREHGGAVYSRSIHDSQIDNCSFYHCVAKYLGGAVYFQSRKYGQWVDNCTIEECAPGDSYIFNDYCYKLWRE